MAEVIIKSSKNLGIKAKAKKIQNPEKRWKNIIINPILPYSLGLKPIKFNENTIEKDIKLITKYKNIGRNAPF